MTDLRWELSIFKDQYFYSTEQSPSGHPLFELRTSISYGKWFKPLIMKLWEPQVHCVWSQELALLLSRSCPGSLGFFPNFFSFLMIHGHPITRLVYPHFPLGCQADTIKEAAGHSPKTQMGRESVTQKTSRGILLDDGILWRMPDQRSWLSLNKMA